MNLQRLQPKHVWVICPCCDGNGQVENPAFANGFTSAEWDDMRHDYDGFDGSTAAERYLRGDYDVQCKHCGGSGKAQEPDISQMTFAEKRVLAARRRHEREEAEYRRQCAYELAAGA